LTAVREQTVNLCFHGVGTPGRELEPGEERYWIDVDTFHRVLDLALEEPRIRLSFDDGNASDVTVALPALLDRGLRATFFVLAGRLDRPGSLATEDVRQLVSAGMRVGSHGMDHVPWRHQDDATLHRELVDARQHLEGVLGSPIDEAALPLGRYDRRVLRLVRRAGYRNLHTSDRCWSAEGAWLQPRFSVQRDDTAAALRQRALSRPAVPQRLRSDAVRLVKRLR
jgi:peptidoglycan/xylan/chitin deacetylase (PgdA/CDA1 family)